jgi:hypothetical protein
MGNAAVSLVTSQFRTTMLRQGFRELFWLLNRLAP